MPISIESDPTLPQGYIKVNGTTAATVTSTGLTTASLQNAAVTQAKLAPNVVGNGPSFRGGNAATQSIPNVTWTKVTLQTENHDTDNSFANSRFTAPIAGYYQVSACIAYTATISVCWVAIFRNGSVVAANTVGTTSSGAAVSDLVYLSIGDYIELYTYQGSGSAATVASAGDRNFMSAFLARAA
jgi:hypothetical protein